MTEDKITTTSNIQSRSNTQETPQQVRLREAKDAASRSTSEEHTHTDIPGIIGRIEDALDNIGHEALSLQSSEELAAFLNHINVAAATLATLAEAERQKALVVADATEEEY